MESTKFLTTSLLTAGLMAVGTSANAALTDGLVGYYDGSSNANSALASDADALDNTGIGTGAAASSVAGGDAYQFDGTGADSLTALTTFGTTLGTDLGDTFTLQAWYNVDDNADPSGNSGDRMFIWENASDHDLSYWIDEDGGTDNGNNVDGNGAVYIGSGPTTNFAHVHTFAGNQWDHLLQTFVSAGGSTTVSTYINGVFVGSDTETIATFGNVAGIEETEGINFGRARDSSSDRPFDGLIDEIGIWNRELTGAEIAEAFARGGAGQALVVPEPGSMALLAIGGLLIARRRRA